MHRRRRLASGLWSVVRPGSRLLSAVSRRCHECGTKRRTPAAGPTVTCRTAECGRRTFVEQISGLTRRHGQQTERLRSTLAAIGLALAGRAGSRLAGIVGAPVSRSTVLRLVDALPEPKVSAPRVVGVDEHATRKGRHYGTVLVDVETRRPIDLLPDRESSTLAAWLAQRPGIEVVCRDRAPFFAEGATVGAPQAVQVADRWHLWHNLSEAAERSIAQHRRCLRVLVPETPEATGTEPGPTEESSGSPWPTGHRFADRTRTTHATIHALVEAGHSRRAIQRQLGMTNRTVKRSADAARPDDLFIGQWQARTSVLDEYKPYLDDRWNEGCTKGGLSTVRTRSTTGCACARCTTNSSTRVCSGSATATACWSRSASSVTVPLPGNTS